MRALIAAVLSLAVAAVATAERRRAVGPPRNDGPCAVRGLANVFLSTDGGRTWSQNAEPPARSGISDVTALDTEPESLVAVVGRGIYDSLDAGCSWTLRHTITDEIKHKISIAAGPGGRALVWAEEFVYRYDRGEVTALEKPSLVGAIGVDPGNREHLRMLDKSTGAARESFDGGATWQFMGAAGGGITASAFDPTDFDHIVAAVQSRGVMISRNGGRAWTAGATGRTVCNLDFGGGRPDVLWATFAVQGTQPWVYRSPDGGRVFEAIGGVSGLENGVCLALMTSPHDQNVVSVPIPLRDLHQFDAVTKTATPFTCCGGQTLRIAYSRKDAARVYAYATP